MEPEANPNPHPNPHANPNLHRAAGGHRGAAAVQLLSEEGGGEAAERGLGRRARVWEGQLAAVLGVEAELRERALA